MTIKNVSGTDKIEKWFSGDAVDILRNLYYGEGEGYCGVRDKTGGIDFECTRDSGHAGIHVAHYSDGTPCGVWTDE